MSMFTGLKAVNHFGRPDMSSFLKFVQKKHSYVNIFVLPLSVIHLATMAAIVIKKIYK